MAGSVVWLGGWWGVDMPLLPSAVELMVAPWNVDGNTTQLVPAEYMNVATLTRSHANAALMGGWSGRVQTMLVVRPLYVVRRLGSRL